ncbi:MAG: type II secretion system protein GspK [Roseiarcus sp.]|jgi:general secretion pathway protein K
MARSLRAQRGFALALVVWGLGVIALLTLAYAYEARLRTQATGNIVGGAQAEALAEAGVNIAILDGLDAPMPHSGSTRRFPIDGRPVFCGMPQGAVAAILVEDEGGKVDINSAPKGLLRAMIAGFGVDEEQSERLASAIVSFRSAPTNDLETDARAYRVDGRPYGPKHALFQTTLELDQVLGMPQALFRSLTPFVTVYSNRPAIDPLVAPPALLVALAGGAPGDVQAFVERPYPNTLDRAALFGGTGLAAGGNAEVFLVHAEVSMPNKSVFVREAIVDLRSGGRPDSDFTIREWRTGATRYGRVLAELLASGSAGSALPC